MMTSRSLARVCYRLGTQIKPWRMTNLTYSVLRCKQRSNWASVPRYLSTTPRTLSCDSNSDTEQKSVIFNVQDPADFKARVVGSEIPVVLNFHATWCGPCKLLGPRLESIIAKKEGKVVLAKLDVDELSDVAMEYNISSVPTIVGMKNGKELDKFVGLQEDDIVNSFVEKLIN